MESTRLMGVPCTLDIGKDTITANFRYNLLLKDEIKAMDGARWNPDSKAWTFKASNRNFFRLQYLEGLNPYAPYDAPLKDYTTSRTPYKHQIEMTRHIITRRHCLIAAEMGTGKTLGCIEAMEWAAKNESITKWLWVAPKSAIYAVQLEFKKWNSFLSPDYVTYESLKHNMYKDYQGVVFDECSKLKNPTAQRSKMAMDLSELIRNKYQEKGSYVILMSGTPAPHDPANWWNICLTEDTVIRTSEGPKRIKELIDIKFKAQIGSQSFDCVKGFFCTGEKETYKLETKEGYTLTGTADHLIKTDVFGIHYWKELGQLQENDKIVLDCHNDWAYSWDGEGSFEDGYIVGNVFGDGCVYEKEGCIYANISVDASQLSYMQKLLPNANFSTSYNFHCIKSHDKRIWKLIRQYEITTSKQITRKMLIGTSSEFIRGFLSSFFDCDGNVENSRLRLTLCQTDSNRIGIVQQLLLLFGIKSKVRKKHKSPNNTMNSQTTNILIIDNESAIKFAKIIGFKLNYKQLKLETRAKNRNKWEEEKTATVSKVIPSGIKKVYDCTIEDKHEFVANGIVVHNCEIACPGYFREGNLMKFKNRLGLIENVDSMTGGAYPRLVTWWDDEKKCSKCGQYEKDGNHDLMSGGHSYLPSRNEIKELNNRMKGLTLVQFKKDCLDLPEKVYRIIECPPSQDMIRAGKIIARTKGAAQALILLRELSDGFQYKEVETGETEDCPICGGTGRYDIPEPGECPTCKGKGKTVKIQREAVYVDTPKDKVLQELLEEFDERIVIYGGFQGTIDKIVKLIVKSGWKYVKADGRGWSTNLEGVTMPQEMLWAFQENKVGSTVLDCPIAFIGQPGAAGMGLTLTASEAIVYYSNDFNAESRIQSEDRIHRPGCKGACIIDLVCLESDRLILQNLQKKRDLQQLSMEELANAFK